MNGNRMKYTSTPTFGMQKRGLFPKRSTPVRQAPETPDFSKASGMETAAPFGQPPQTQPPFAQPAAPMTRAPFAQAAPQMPFAQPVGTMPQQAQPSAPFPQGGAQPFAQTTQMPFAAPAFLPTAPGMQLPPMQSAQQPLPLGNTVPPIQLGAPFSTHAQGFVPPQRPAPSVQPAAPQMSYGGMTGGQQTASPFSAAMGYAQQSTPSPVYPPVQPVTPPAQPASPAARPPRAPMEADKLWTIFLFGLLPLLLIPCLFVPRTLDFLRYAFLGLTVVGLGGMWYRQMYGSSTRLIVSMVYVAVCIGILAMLMQGGRDARQVSANLPAQNESVQQTPEPDGQPAAEPEDLLATATPAPTASGPSQAELRLQLFMSLWQVNNPTEMVELVQPSWRAKQENATQSLFTILKNRTPQDYVVEEIDGAETDNSRTITMRATIDKNNGKAPTIYRFMVMMVKEGDEWYVNPNSLATNDGVEETDENVVNNKNAVGNVTEPPRTTVTPAPPANTTLYYNTGAHYYHMDPNCPSVKSEYLPFDNQFSYADLASVKETLGLTPCLKCNAPLDPLE